jgi:hypothetical protein
MQRNPEKKHAFTYHAAKVVIFGISTDLYLNLVFKTKTFQHRPQTNIWEKLFKLNHDEICMAELHDISISSVDFFNRIFDNEELPVIPNDTAVAILCLDPLSEKCMDALDRFIKNIPADFKGHVIICPNDFNKVRLFCGTFEQINDQQRELKLRRTNLDSILNDIAIYCTGKQMTIEGNVDKILSLVENKIQDLYDNTNQFPGFLKKQYSIQFNFNNVTPETLIAAINCAKESYSRAMSSSPIIPCFISNTYLNNRLPLNYDNTKVNTTSCLKLLDILQGPGGTDTKSFKYQLISALFNLMVNTDQEASEAISIVINSLKSTKQIYQWEQIKPFLMWKRENNLPNDPGNEIMLNFIALNDHDTAKQISIKK